MRQFIQLIIDNKEWIFSGIGVAIVVIIVKIFLDRKKNSTQYQNIDIEASSGNIENVNRSLIQQTIKAGNSSTNIQTGDGSPVTISHTTEVQSPERHETKPIEIGREGAFVQMAIIREGDYQEFIWLGSTVRVTVSQIEEKEFYRGFSFGRREKCLGATLDISTGGGLVYGGENCIKESTNKYSMPQREFSQEEPYSVYEFHVSNESFNFFRVYVDHINPYTREVKLNLFFARMLISK